MSGLLQTPQAERKVVVVLGMHRSGTSLLGSLAQSLGVDMGEELYPADEHNPAGYFEDRQCVDIQDRMLALLGQQPWHGPNGMLPLAPRWWQSAELQPLVAELEAWLDGRLANTLGLWGVKDPRTTRFLPLWNMLLAKRGVRPCYVLAVRHPAEVVASIHARDAARKDDVYRIWLRFNMEALLHAGENLAGVFSYGLWFEEGAQQLQAFAQALGISLATDQAEAVLQQRLREDLHRQSADDSAAPEWAQVFHRRLCELGQPPEQQDIKQLAAEAEYADALLRQGDAPAWHGELHAVLTSVQGFQYAVELSAKLRDAGHRVVLATEEGQEEAVAPQSIALLRREPGPWELGGWLHTRQAYAAWLWLRSRTYSCLHIEGGQGLAAHVLDARRQGWPAAARAVHVHYFGRPGWLEPDGLVHLLRVEDAEALCLERRIAADTEAVVHAASNVEAILRRVLQGARQRPGVVSQATPNERPLVSVCITHFNRPDLLSDCLDSVRAQTYSPFEVVLVDDGSTQPAAVAYLDALQAEFDAKGWTLIRQENRYLGAARNAAARAARGEYLFILDDDNLLMPDGLMRAVQVAERTQADIVTAVMALFTGQAGTKPCWPERLWPHSGSCALQGALENNLGDANALVRRESLFTLAGYTEERGVGAEDWELYAKAILGGMLLEHSLMPLSWYRIDAGSMSRSGNWWRDYRRALRPYEASLPEELRELPALACELKRKVGALEPLAVEAEHAKQCLKETQLALEQTQQALSETQRALSDTRQALSDTRQALSETQHLAYALYTSTSWKVTAPMRFLSRRLKTLRSGRVLHVSKNAFRSLVGEIRRHGVLGVIQRLPYYFRRRDFILALLDEPRGAGSRLWSFIQESKPARPARLHPDLLDSRPAINTLVSIVIPTLNPGGEFPMLLRKLKEQQGIAGVEVVIVDSGSTDGSVEVARQWGCKVVEIAPSDFSHSGARNLGAEQASGEYLLFMVQDAYPIGTYWIHGMLRYLLDYAEHGLVAVSCAETPRSDSDMMYDSMIDTHYRFLGCHDQDRLGRLKGIDHMALRSQGQLSDVACLIRREVFAGYRYRGDYAEDLDLGMRIIRDGKAVAMLASVKVIHSHNRSAYYYLKRSFVDVAFLVGMFDDFPCPQVHSLHGLLEAIDNVARHLSAWVMTQSATPEDGGSMQETLSRWMGAWRTQLISLPATNQTIALGEPRLDAALVALRERTRQARPDSVDMDDDMQQFVDMFLGRVEHFGHYATSVYDMLDARSRAELRAAMMKIFAATVGSTLGFAYVQFKDGTREQAALVREIFAEMKAGV